MEDGNQYSLESTLEVLTMGSGEVGVAKKIVGFVQDCFRLDALDRIQQTENPDLVCEELHKLVDAQVDDEEFTEIAIAKARSTIVEFLSNGGRIDMNNLEVVLLGMEKFKSNVLVQKNGCALLLNVLLPGGVLDNNVLSFIVTERNVAVLVTILENYQDDAKAMLAATGLLSGMCANLHSQGPSALKKTLSEILERSNVLPLCVVILQKYHELDDALVCVFTVPILLMPVGGEDRPILKTITDAPITGGLVSRWISRWHVIFAGQAD